MKKIVKCMARIKELQDSVHLTPSGQIKVLNKKV